MFTFAIALSSALSASVPTFEIHRFQHVSADYVMSIVAPAPETGLPKIVPDVVSWVVDPATNSVVVRGPKSQMAKVLPIMKAYDVRSPVMELRIEGKIPSIGHEHSQTVQLTGGGTWRIEEASASLALHIKVLVAKPDYAVLFFEHKFRGTTSRFSFRIRARETVSLTPEESGSNFAPPTFGLKVTLAKVAIRT